MMPTAVVTVDAEGFHHMEQRPGRDVLFPALARGLDRASAGSVNGVGGWYAWPWKTWAAGSPGWCATRWRASRLSTPEFLESRSVGGRTLAVRTRQLDRRGQVPGRGGARGRSHGPAARRGRSRSRSSARGSGANWRRAVSHEIRNPLVAIKTLTQLLPHRYHGRDVSGWSSARWSTREVGRLDNIVTQIEGFAHPTPGVTSTGPNLSESVAGGSRRRTRDDRGGGRADQDHRRRRPTCRGMATARRSSQCDPAPVRQRHRSGFQPKRCARKSASGWWSNRMRANR